MRFAIRAAKPHDLPAIIRLGSGPDVTDDVRRWHQTLDEEYRIIFANSKPMSLVVNIIDEKTGAEKLVAAAIAAMIHEWAFEALLTSNEPYTNPKFLSWIAQGRKPFMSNRHLARANVTEGATMIPMTFSWSNSLTMEAAAYVRQMVFHRFADRYAGNKLRRMVAEPCNPVMLRGCLEAGYRIVNDYGSWAEANGMLNSPIRPHLVVAEQADAFATVNSFLLRMFCYSPPQLKLTILQQEVLILALEGRADPEIADILGITEDAVKARWRLIYHHADTLAPGLLPSGKTGGRGVEKRRTLLSYLRDRPEELRPHDWRAVAP
jgi:DNA-directed RNA polymerase specialized sigma24 family protein